MNTKKILISLINIFMILLSLLAILKSIYISFDIDEGYAIAQSYRLLKGDRLIAEMWEPHQFSAFASALFMLPYLAITAGNTTGIIIYLRIIGSVIHLCIGCWFFVTAKKEFNTTIGLLIALIHLNFLPKWISIPEFELMHYWAVCVLFLALFSWSKQMIRTGLLICSSIALWVAVLCYPTMMILYPAYIIFIFILTREKRQYRWRSVIYFTLPIFLLGIAFIGYLLSYMTFQELLENLSYILMDESHSVSLRQRFREFIIEILSFSLEFLACMSVSLAITLGLKKIMRIKGRDTSNISTYKLPIVLLLTVVMLCIYQIVCSLLGDAGQFFMYFRLVVIVLFGISCYQFCRQENRIYVMLGIIPGFLSVLASVILTNMTFEVALARVYIAVIASCFMACTVLRENEQESCFFRNLLYSTAIIFILSLLMCKLLLVRITGCIPISIKMHMTPITDGPAAGLLLKEELAQVYAENITFLRENTTTEDCVLYFGCENIYYLMINGEFATPSVQSTSVFNEMYLGYYENKPDKFPNVVVIDKTFQTNPFYNYHMYSAQHQIVYDWIQETFENAASVENNSLILLRNGVQKYD